VRAALLVSAARMIGAPMGIIPVLLLSAGAIGVNLQIVSKKSPTTEAHLLPIAYDAGSNQVLLGICGARRGNVYDWTKDFEPVEDLPEPTYENVAFAADSFTDFLKKLRPMK
jgi:hypothetical protein